MSHEKMSDFFDEIQFVLAIVSVFVSLVGLIYFYINRDHPVLVFRCSMITIIAMLALAVDQLISALPKPVRRNSNMVLQNYLIALLGMSLFCFV